MRFLILLALAGSAWAEYAVLANGSRVRADRHESDGERVRLYAGAGYIEMQAAQIQGFEAEEPGPAALGAPSLPPAGASPAPAIATPAELADRAADKYGLPRRLLRSVMAAESGSQVDAVSPKGAIGLMQLMPGTARDLGVDPRDPAQNVDAGARYLRDLLEKYNYGLWHALAAYNAGPGAVDRYKGIPPYRETVRYVQRIDRDFRQESPSRAAAQ